MDPQWTDHAALRGRQRFPDVDLVAAYQSARPAGRATKRQIRIQCPRAALRWMRGWRGRYFLVTKDRIVFVVKPPGVVITVFRLEAASAPQPSSRTPP